MKWSIVLFFSIYSTFLQAGTIDELKSIRSVVKPRWKMQRQQIRQYRNNNPFYSLEEEDKSKTSSIYAKTFNQEKLTDDEENYLLAHDRLNGMHNYPDPYSPAIDKLTSQVNKILQHIAPIAQVFELEAMYYLSRGINDIKSPCTRKELGNTAYSKNYTYDPKAMMLLASKRVPIKAVQIVHTNDMKIREYYYRGVLDKKHVIIQITVYPLVDKAKINIFTLKPLNATIAKPHASKPAITAMVKEKENTWGELYGGKYTNGDFSVEGGIGFEYEYDKHNLPKKLSLWEVEAGYKSENFEYQLTSRLDTKKQEVRAKISPKDTSHNALELFLQGDKPGVTVYSGIDTDTAKIRGKTSLYKKKVEGEYKFSSDLSALNFQTTFENDQQNKVERYTVSKDIFQHSGAYYKERLNLKLETKHGQDIHNDQSIWLTYSAKF